MQTAIFTHADGSHGVRFSVCLFFRTISK